MIGDENSTDNSSLNNLAVFIKYILAVVAASCLVALIFKFFVEVESH